MITKFDKALAVLVVAGLVPIIQHFTGFELAADLQPWAVAGLTAVFVYFTRNKVA